LTFRFAEDFEMLGKDARAMGFYREAALTRQFEVFCKPEGREKSAKEPSVLGHTQPPSRFLFRRKAKINGS
jgi:hypothetical protein